MLDLPSWVIGSTAALGLVRSAAGLYQEGLKKPAPGVQMISLAPPRDSFEMREHLLKAQADLDSQTGLAARDLTGGQFRVQIRGLWFDGEKARLSFKVISNHTLGKIEILSGHGSVLGAGTCGQWGDNLFRVEVTQNVFENWWNSTPNDKKYPKKNRMMPLRLYAKLSQGEVSRIFIGWATESYELKLNGEAGIRYRRVRIESRFLSNTIDW